MLAKMGYKQGDSIGRNTSAGIVEPIPIQIKNDRRGLGREAAIKQLEEYKEKLRKAKTEFKSENATTSIHQFRQRMAQKTNEKQLEADLWYIITFEYLYFINLFGTIHIQIKYFFFFQQMSTSL